MIFLQILVICLVAVFAFYQIYALVRAIIAKKKNKPPENKGDDK